MRKIFMEDLPTKLCRGRVEINWPNSIGYKCKFIYNNIEDEIEIIDYDIKTKHIYLKYNNKIDHMYISSFKSCSLGKMLGKISSEFKIEVGTNIKDDKRNITIIDREYRKIIKKNGSLENKKWYKYKCNKCGYKEGWVEESNLLKRPRCSCCDNKTVVKGINDLATTEPWMVEYLSNKEDAYKYTYGSHKKINMICPICGHKKKFSPIDLKCKGLGCNKCSDGIKYPNKFMFNLLEQIDVRFENEYSPEWLEEKRFDFYIPSKNLIIEMDGDFHYSDNYMNGTVKEESQAIDKCKDKQAETHNLKVVRVKCNYKNNGDRFDYVKSSILNSELSSIFDLSYVDWIKCDAHGCKSLIKEVCNYRNENKGIKTSELAEYFKLHISTIIRYLKTGDRIGWCNYTPYKKDV